MDLIDFGAVFQHPVKRLMARTVALAADPLVRYRDFNETYRRLLADPDTRSNFFDKGLRVLDVDYSVSDEDLRRIPAEGPVIVVANHPYGGIDGVVLGSILARVRPDVRLLVNYLLAHMEGLRPYLINVDPFGGTEAARKNFGPMKECLRWLKQGGALITFPSGTVSHLHLKRRQVADPPWVENLAGLIRRTGATVVPAFFVGRNSNLFQTLGMLHPLVRTLLLPREVINKGGRTLEVRIGNAISPGRLEKFTTDEALMNFLRLKTYILQNRQVADKTSFFFNRRLLLRRKGNKVAPLATAAEPANLQREIDGLPPAQLLTEAGEFQVFYAWAHQVPGVLAEIGRLREMTFRAVGEGSGLARDLDRFDVYYRHLFMWNREQREIVGAYRLGLTDEILPRQGRAGLYTSTLFRYKPGVIESLSPAIELGRSFIVAEYQRKHASLSLIWRGIGQFIAQFPQYKTLFGPVSISKEYQAISKSLIVLYLKEHTLDPELADKVRAKKPPRSRTFGRLDKHSFSATVKDIEDVSALISEIEKEERGVPVLLRQYLKLNGTVLSFNVDPEFSDCIDGLLLVDLTKTNEKTIRRYMGEEGADRFYAYHEMRARERAEVTRGGE